MGEKEDSSLIRQAADIAKRDLRSCYGELGIYAGHKNFEEYWERDSCNASLGASAIGDFGIVRRNLELYRDHQREDGLIPLRIDPHDHALALVGIEAPYREMKVRYKAPAPWAEEVADSPALYVISACEYARKSGDREWLEENEGSLRAALDNLYRRRNRANPDLIDEGPVGGWADMTQKSGNVACTNILAWKAGSELSRMVEDDGTLYARTERLGSAILDKLWLEDEGYFADWIDRKGGVKRDFFADGNVLACAWGLADREKAQRVYSYIDEHHLADIPIITCHPALPQPMDLFVRTVFVNYYPNKIITWMSPFEALGRAAIDKEKGIEDLAKFAKTIVDEGTVHEVLFPDGRPVSYIHYKSEPQFAQTAGTFLHAAKELGML